MRRSGTEQPSSRGWFVAAVSACICWTQAGCSGGVASADKPPPAIVTVAEARKTTIPLRGETFGTTRSLKQVTIRARVRGFLTEMYFEEGADVKADQLLFVIDEKPYKAKVDSASAQLDEARASLAKSKQSKAPEIAAAQRAIDQALLYLARVEDKRQRNLLARSASSQSDVDQADANLKKADAQLESDQANLDQAKADYNVNILSAQAKVAAAEAALREAELDLGYCRMTSPIDGRIGQAKVKLGNLVGPGEGSAEYTELADVRQLDPMGVDIQVSSRYLARATELMKHGIAARLSRPGIDGEVEYPYPGKVYFIDNAIEPTTSTFLSKVEVPNPEKSLLPGEYIRMVLAVGEAQDVVVVPEQSVMVKQGEVSEVYVVGTDNTVSAVRVRATDTYQGMRVIKEGLSPGQRVIVDGIQQVRPGMTVEVEKAAAPAENRSPTKPRSQKPSTTP